MKGIQDILQVEGVGYKGYGLLAKYVMHDTSLSLEAKAIYAYFCSLSGNGTTSFPSRKTILENLKVSKDTYYKHFGLLLEQGYIEVRHSNAGGKGIGFQHNVYTLISNPKKFKVTPSKEEEAAYSRIRFNGIKSLGYGMIPRSVMMDDRLSIKAKGIYAYFCSYAGAGDSAFPTQSSIFYHLQISAPTFYRHYNALLKLDFLRVVQRQINGRFSINDYYLNEHPCPAEPCSQNSDMQNETNTMSNEPCSKISDTQNETKKMTNEPCNQNSDMQNEANTMPNAPYSQNSDMQKYDKPISQNSDTQNSDTQNSDTNNNSITNNSINYKHSLTLSTEKSREEMTEAIHAITDWQIRTNSVIRDPVYHDIYMLFNRTLVDMCCTDVMVLKGEEVTKDQVLQNINEILGKAIPAHDGSLSIADVYNSVIEDYKYAIETREIKNYRKYMQSCIWDALHTYNIKFHSDVMKSRYYN